MSNSSNSYLENILSHGPTQGVQTLGDPSKIIGDSADLIAWSMAQDAALSKVKIFSTMAKSINDQQ